MRILVTKHRLVSDLLKQAGVKFDKILDAASDDDIRGHEVWGLLPHWKTALTSSYVEVTTKVPETLKGTELRIWHRDKVEVKMARYVVKKIEPFSIEEML